MQCNTYRCMPVVVVLSMVTTPAFCWAQDPPATRIKALAQPYIEAEILVGLSIGAIKDGGQSEVHLGKRGGGKAPDSDTIYEIGSVSKAFTGMLLADAVNQGLVKLEQPAGELMPDEAMMPKWKDRNITLVDLATHSSGLPRLPDNMPSLTSDNPYADYTSKLAREFLSKHKLRREPGTKYEYSNLGMSFLGHLICKKSGGDYDQLLARRLAGPLGMKDTRVALTKDMKSRLATPHIGPGNVAVNWDCADMPGAGGIRSSTRDMLRLAAACIEPPQNDVGRAIDLSWKIHRQGGVGEWPLGLGWHVAADGSTRWHNGQTGGYHATMMVNRNLKLALVVLTNTASMETDTLASDLIRMLAGEEEEVKPRQFEAKVKVPPEVRERYVGRYQLAPNFIFTVAVKDEKLMVGVTNQPTFQVFPRSETEWFYKVVDATLTFKVDDQGKCNELELFQNGIRQKAKRIE